MRKALLAILLVPAVALGGDWYTDDVVTPSKVDAKPLPPGANASKFIRGSDWNNYVKAPSELLRAKVKALDAAYASDKVAQDARDDMQEAALSQGAVGGNDTLVTSTGGTTARSLASRFSDVVNVKDFSLACDGVADDTAALTTLLASLGTTSKTLVVLGPCVVNSDITIPAIQPVRMEGNGGFIGSGVVSYTAVPGQVTPAQPRLTGTIIQSFRSGVFQPATNSSATGATVTYDAAKGAQKVTWATASQSQYGGIKAEGNWNLSADDNFAVDLGVDHADPGGSQFLTYVRIMFCFDTGVGLSNYAWTADAPLNIQPKPPGRFLLPVKKSELTVVGTPAWGAVRRIEIRFYRSGAATTSAQNTAYFYGVWKNVTARPKIVFSFDDGDTTVASAAFPILQAAGMRATVYLNGSTVGVNPATMTLAQVHGLYAAGWDVGSHTWDHTRLAWIPVSLTRSGTVATFLASSTEPHGLSPGATVVLSGWDEPGYNGSFTVDTVPNAYSFTITVSSALEPTARGYYGSWSSTSIGEIRRTLQLQREWQMRRGLLRGLNHFAYPNGHHSAAAITELQALGYKTARTVGLAPLGGSTSSFLGATYPFHLPALALGGSTAVTLLASIDAAAAKGLDVFVYGHAVKPAAGSTYDFPTAEFQALIDGLKSRRDAGQIDVVTISEWYDRL